MLSSPWARFYSNSCCLCCHVRTGTIILGVWYLIINSVVLLILLSALTDPDQYHLTSAELGGEFEFMDDANMCIATAISLLMILICAMATYGAYKQHAAWIIPFFCYQIFDFALNTLVAISVLVYPSTIQDYLRQLPSNFPYKEEIMSVNPTCLVVIILLFISIILAFKVSQDSVVPELPSQGWKSKIPPSLKVEKVQDHLLRLNVYKSMGLDDRYPSILKEQADVVA
uniref:Lysosomal protein transmembrane 4 beta n=1 Tax=Gallus gallus TaxID=9031 RepID=A0A8V0YBJ6_CHICK